MASFITPVALADDALAEHIAQITEDLAGLRNIPISLTGINDAASYALTLKNVGAGAKGLIVYAADGVTTLLQVDANGVKISADGVTPAAGSFVTPTGVQTLTNKTLTSPHMTGAVVDSGGLTVTAGNVGIGQAPNPYDALVVGGTLNASSAAARGIDAVITLVAQANSDILSGAFIDPTFNTNGKTSLGLYTLVVGSNSTAATASSKYGISVGAQTGANVNNYGVYIEAPSGASGQNLGLLNLGGAVVNGATMPLGFYGGSGYATKPAVTGAKAGNAALTSLLAILANFGLITDSSS